MAVTLTTASAQAMVNALVDALDSAQSTAGRLKFYTAGTTLVADLQFHKNAFNACSAFAATSVRANLKTGYTVTDSSADSAGVVTRWNATTAAGTTKFSGTATATGGGGDITFTSTSIGAGEAVTLTSFYVALKLAA